MRLKYPLWNPGESWVTWTRELCADKTASQSASLAAHLYKLLFHLRFKMSLALRCRCWPPFQFSLVDYLLFKKDNFWKLFIFFIFSRKPDLLDDDEDDDDSKDNLKLEKENTDYYNQIYSLNYMLVLCFGD